MFRPSLYGTLFALLLCVQPAAQAHESRPALLVLQEQDDGRYEVYWKVPAMGNRRLRLALEFEGCRADRLGPVRTTGDAAIERFVVDCGIQGIAGRQLHVPGLAATITDVFLRVEYANGDVLTSIIRPRDGGYRFSPTADRVEVLRSFGLLGIEHIAGGADHLLFVLALMLLVAGWRRLVLVITSFTVAHSLSLSAMVLGVVPQPGRAVEAVIALSILLLACELLRRKHGATSLTIRRPWLPSFVFGLLHGVGFAGALLEYGLPRGEAVAALFAFNLGIELGQLAFVAAVALVGWLLGRLGQRSLRYAEACSVWVIGIASAYWFVERLSVLA